MRGLLPDCLSDVKPAAGGGVVTVMKPAFVSASEPPGPVAARVTV